MEEITLADLMEKKQAMSFESAQEEGTEELEGNWHSSPRRNGGKRIPSGSRSTSGIPRC